MAHLNPTAIVLVAFCACVGALAGSWLIGLTVGLGITLAMAVAESFIERR